MLLCVAKLLQIWIIGRGMNLALRVLYQLKHYNFFTYLNQT